MAEGPGGCLRRIGEGGGAKYFFCGAEMPAKVRYVLRNPEKPIVWRDIRVHAKGVVLCERAYFCLLSAFYNRPPSKNPSKNLGLIETLTRRLLRTLLKSTYC